MPLVDVERHERLVPWQLDQHRARGGLDDDGLLRRPASASAWACGVGVGVAPRCGAATVNARERRARVAGRVGRAHEEHVVARRERRRSSAATRTAAKLPGPAGPVEPALDRRAGVGREGERRRRFVVGRRAGPRPAPRAASGRP